MRGQLLVFPSRKEGNSLKPLETTTLRVPEITWGGTGLAICPRSSPKEPREASALATVVLEYL